MLPRRVLRRVVLLVAVVDVKGSGLWETALGLFGNEAWAWSLGLGLGIRFDAMRYDTMGVMMTMITIITSPRVNSGNAMACSKLQ